MLFDPVTRVRVVKDDTSLFTDSGRYKTKVSVEILFRKCEAPLAPSLPPQGAGAHTIPLYYREIPIPVIQHYRDWGATAAGRSPWSVIRKELSTKPQKKMIRYFLDRFATNSNPLTTERAASGMNGEDGA